MVEQAKLFYPEGKSPSKPNLILNGPEASHVFLNLDSLPVNMMSVLDTALIETSGLSLNKIYQNQVIGDLDKVLYRRLRTFSDNYLRVRLFQNDAPLQAVAGWIYNSLVEAKVISLEDSIRLVEAESTALFYAKIRYGLTDTGEDTEMPLHTPCMYAELDSLKAAVENIGINNPQIPVVTTTGKVLKSGVSSEEIKKEIINQAIDPINTKAMHKKLRSLGFKTLYGVSSLKDEDSEYATLGPVARVILGATGAGVVAIAAYAAFKKRNK